MHRADEFVDDMARAWLGERYGAAWVAGLPALMGRLLREHRWTPVRRLTGGCTACVLVVDGPGGRCVVKVTPCVTRSRHEAAALEALGCSGVGPRLLDHWEEPSEVGDVSVLVTQLLGDGSSLRHEGANAPSVEALGAMLRAVEECGAQALSLRTDTLHDHLGPRLERARGGGLHGTQAPADSELVAARETFHALMSPTPGTWVHGSLHPGNLVPGADGRLLVVDPRPFAADPAYDAAEVCLKWGSERHGRRHNLADGRALWRRLRHRLDHDGERVDAWMRVLAATGF
ncbi:phosphotransferase [Streptomyces sp. NPDC087866]|uniref:phosphotransferase n=1 Tax=Streptomyces sp. NPDC087866 TaxID=3365815 RepID=UPI00380AE9D4